MEGEEKKKKPSTVAELKASLIESEKNVSHWMELSKKKEEESTAYQKVNTLLEEELAKVRSANEELHRLNHQLANELQILKSRGFFARLLNRDIK